MPKRKYKYPLRDRRRFFGLPTPYITLLVQTGVFRRRYGVGTVRFAFAPDGEMLAATQPLDPNVPAHAALIAKARERALRHYPPTASGANGSL
jgi:hypothetical protein